MIQLRSIIAAALIALYSGSIAYAASQTAVDPTLFYLGKGKEHLMPQMIKAAKTVALREDCLSMTDGAWGIAKKDVDIPNKKGFLFRFTCQVSDLPNSSADNFWISPKDIGKPEAVFRQQKYRNGTLDK